jgi:transposase
MAESRHRFERTYTNRDQLLYKSYLEGATLAAAETSHLDGIPRQTKERWKAAILEYGMTPIDWKEEEARRNLSHPPHHADAVMDDATVAALKTLAEQQPDLYLDQMQDEMLRITGKRIALITLSTTLRERLGMTLQKLSSMSSAQDDAARLAYVNHIHILTEDPKMFIFIDETAKDRNASRKRMGWAKRGRGHHYRRDYERWQDTRYTFIAAMDMFGFVFEASSCVYRKTGADDENNAAGTIDQERFEEYVKSVLVPTLGRYALGEPRSIVVMDNAPTHVGARTRQLIEGAGAKLVYLPPNSPDMNPIEECFHVYKANLKRYNNDRGIRTVEMAHLHAFLAVTPEIARAEYRQLRGAIRNVPKENSDKEQEEEEAVALAAALVVIYTLGF